MTLFIFDGMFHLSLADFFSFVRCIPLQCSFLSFYRTVVVGMLESSVYVVRFVFAAEWQPDQSWWRRRWRHDGPYRDSQHWWSSFPTFSIGFALESIHLVCWLGCEKELRTLKLSSVILQKWVEAWKQQGNRNFFDSFCRFIIDDELIHKSYFV